MHGSKRYLLICRYISLILTITDLYPHTVRELPGNYNHILMSELFHEQSNPWADIGDNHVNKLLGVANDFLRRRFSR